MSNIFMTPREKVLNQFQLDADYYAKAWRVEHLGKAITPYYTSEERAVGAMRELQEKYLAEQTKATELQRYVLIPHVLDSLERSYTDDNGAASHKRHVKSILPLALALLQITNDGIVFENERGNKQYVDGFVYYVKANFGVWEQFIDTHDGVWATRNPMLGDWTKVTSLQELRAI